MVVNDLILPAYSYLYDLIRDIVDGKPLSIHEVLMVGGRYSGKTTAIEKFLILLCTFPNLRIGIAISRFGEEGCKELFNEFVETAEYLGIDVKYNNKKREIIIYGYKIRFYYEKSLSKSKAQRAGLARFVGVDYIITWFEEAFEFSQDYVAAFNEAIRGDKKDVQTLQIYSCNPWAKSSWFIQKCAAFQNWDLSVLKSTGSQIGVYERKFTETLTNLQGEKYTYELVKKTLVHYTNWRITKNVLGDEQIKNILDTWNLDRNRAMVVDYGLPGYESGAIYTHELHKLGRPIYQEHSWVSGGGDYGWSTREDGGKTAFVFVGASLENGVDVYGEYIQDNHKAPKSIDVLCREVVHFYISQMREYCTKIGYNSFIPLRVRVDNSARELIYLLNKEAEMQRCHKWLSFHPCAKYKIEDRIVFELAILARHYFRLGEKCLMLKSDLEMSAYEDTQTQKRINKYDHCLNAFEYACEPFMYSFAKILNTQILRK